MQKNYRRYPTLKIIMANNTKDNIQIEQQVGEEAAAARGTTSGQCYKTIVVIFYGKLPRKENPIISWVKIVHHTEVIYHHSRVISML
jgi:hypothetical protein